MTQPPRDLEAFCEREYPRLLGAMTLYVGDHGLAEEIVQETLIKVCEKWSKVSTMPAPGAWAHRVAMNTAKSRFRRRALERRVAERSTVTEVESSSETAEAITVRNAVRQLPNRRREAVILRHFGGLSVDEAATAMNLTPAALRSLTHRANQDLRELLAPDHDPEVDHAHR